VTLKKKMHPIILVLAVLVPAVSPAITILPPPGLNICWRDAYGRGVGTIPNQCKENQEKQGALCYDKCNTTVVPPFYGVGPVCWETCKEGYHDGGVFCYQGGHSYTKKSYGRGVGYIPGCADGEQEQLALCYKNCADDFESVGPTCWASSAVNPDYTVPCVYQIPFTFGHISTYTFNLTYAYGKTADDCSNLQQDLSFDGKVTLQCILDIIDSIKTGQIAPIKSCGTYISQALPKLISTRVCVYLPTTTVTTTTTTAATTTTSPSG
jgi:hypothetical protein